MPVSRKKLLFYNSWISVIYQILLMISGFVLPNFFIRYYGNDTYGVIASVTQYLQLMTLCDLGFGAVVQASLYKPISQNDIYSISEIFLASKSFFNKIAFLSLGYVIVLIVVFSFYFSNEISWKFSSLIIITLSIKLLFQYYIGISYKLILNAAQYIYIQLSISSIVLILNLFLSIGLMISGLSVSSVLIGSSIVFCVQPLLFKKKALEYFKINFQVPVHPNAIKQKWNGVLQHLATIVLEQSPIVFLSVMTSFRTIAIYSIYHLVGNGLKMLFITIMSSINPLLGNIFVRKEQDVLRKFFMLLLWLNINMTTLIFSVAAISIIPFMKVYTSNLEDNSIYLLESFGFMMCISYAIYVLRLPYNNLIQAIGHFKETQNSAILEILINIVLSFVLIRKIGLIGVPIAMSVALLYRLFYFVYYSFMYILKCSPIRLFSYVLICLIVCLIIIYTSRTILFDGVTYFSWIIYTIKISILAFLELLFFNCIFFRREIADFFNLVKK